MTCDDPRIAHRTAPPLSRDESIDEFRRLAALSPTPLGAVDLPQSLWFALRRHFGSIEDARRAAGVDSPEFARRWSQETIIAEIRRLHREGVRITDLSLKDGHADLLGAIRMYFDGIVAARRAARIPEPPQLHGKRQRWDEARVIAEIEELQRSGESLAASKVPNALLKAGKRYFDSWENAIEAAGISYDEVRLQREPYTEAELIAILRDLARDRPDMMLAELGTQSYFATILRLFGSLEVALARAKIVDWPVRVRLPAMSRADALAALRRREREGKATNWDAVQVDDHLLWHSGILHFGEWQLFTTAARVETESHYRSWTPDKLLDALRDRDRSGRSLKPEDVKRDDPGLYASVVAYFGSYTATVKRVAYTPWALTSWTRELVIERLQALARQRGTNRVTGREAGSALVGACQKHFGSYSAACRAAGLDYLIGLGGPPRTKRATRSRSYSARSAR